MKKRIVSFLLALVLVCGVVPVGLTARAAAVREGLCGPNARYALDSMGILTISGSGPINDYGNGVDSPVRSFGDLVKAVRIEEGISRVGNNFFAFIYTLESASLPRTLKEIGEYAFTHCGKLQTCNFPEGLTKIGTGAFSFCKLQKVALPKTLQEIGGYAFECNSGFTTLTIPGSVKSIGMHAFNTCYGIKNLTIENGVQSIGRGAFCWASAITRVTIPASVKELSESVFYNCSNLTYCDIQAKIDVIPESLVEGCNNLVQVTIPKTVKKVNRTAFQRCENLTALYFPNTVDEIEYACGSTNRSLKTVVIPNANTKILDRDDALGVPGTTTIYGKSRSTAYDYALKYGYNFKDLSQAPAEPAIPGGDDFQFEDVEEGKWYTEAVKFVVNLGLMKGKSKTRFDLDSTTTRAEIVTILYRYDGEPSVSGGKGFSDVTADWAKASTKWASATKVVNGVGNNKFNPNGKISTQDFIVILYRYAESKGYDTGKLTSISKYSDAKQVSNYAQEPIQWAVAAGILEPKGGKLNPKAQTSRAQAAVYLKNFCDFVG